MRIVRSVSVAAAKRAVGARSTVWIHIPGSFSRRGAAVEVSGIRGEWRGSGGTGERRTEAGVAESGGTEAGAAESGGTEARVVEGGGRGAARDHGSSAGRGAAEIMRWRSGSGWGRGGAEWGMAQAAGAVAGGAGETGGAGRTGGAGGEGGDGGEEGEGEEGGAGREGAAGRAGGAVRGGAAGGNGGAGGEGGVEGAVGEGGAEGAWGAEGTWGTGRIGTGIRGAAEGRRKVGVVSVKGAERGERGEGAEAAEGEEGYKGVYWVSGSGYKGTGRDRRRDVSGALGSSGDGERWMGDGDEGEEEEEEDEDEEEDEKEEEEEEEEEEEGEYEEDEEEEGEEEGEPRGWKRKETGVKVDGVQGFKRQELSQGLSAEEKQQIWRESNLNPDLPQDADRPPWKTLLERPAVPYVRDDAAKWQRKMVEKRARRDAESDRDWERGREWERDRESERGLSGGFGERDQEGAADMAKLKVAWLIDELAVLRPAAIVKLLNAQRAWIGMEHVEGVVRGLLGREETLRAIRVCAQMGAPNRLLRPNPLPLCLPAVSTHSLSLFSPSRPPSSPPLQALKWARQTAFYAPIPSLYADMLDAATANQHVPRAQELFDMMLTHGLVPPRRNYEGLIRMFLRERRRLQEGKGPSGEGEEEDGTGGREGSRAVESGGEAGRGPGGFTGFKEMKQAEKAAAEVERGWEVYRQMKQFAELTPSRAVQEEIWAALTGGGSVTLRGSSGRHLVKAEELLRDMEAGEGMGDGEGGGEGGGEGEGEGEGEGGEVGEKEKEGVRLRIDSRARAARYALLLRHAGLAGDVARTENLLSRMRAAGIPPNSAALEAPVVACALAGKRRKDWEGGGVGGGKGGEEMKGGGGGERLLSLAERAERGIEELESEGFLPGQVVLAALMETYNHSGQHEKVLQVWPRVVESGSKFSKRVKIDTGMAEGGGEEGEGGEEEGEGGEEEGEGGEGELEGGEGKSEGGGDGACDIVAGGKAVMVRAYNAYVEGLVGAGEMGRAEEVVGEMAAEGIPGVHLREAYLSLLRGYVRMGGRGGGEGGVVEGIEQGGGMGEGGEGEWSGGEGREEARKSLEAVGGCFRAMVQARCEPNQEAWNLYIRALIQAGKVEEALKVYGAMHSGEEATKKRKGKIKCGGRKKGKGVAVGAGTTEGGSEGTGEAGRVTVIGSGLDGGLAVRFGPNQETYNMVIAAAGAAGDVDTVRSVYTDLRGGAPLAARAPAAAAAAFEVGDTEEEGEEEGNEEGEAVGAMVRSAPAKLKARLLGPARQAALRAVGRRRLLADESAGLKLSQEQRQILSGLILAGADVASDDGAATAAVRFAVAAGEERRERVIEHLYEVFGEWAAGPIVEEEVSLDGDGDESGEVRGRVGGRAAGEEGEEGEEGGNREGEEEGNKDGEGEEGDWKDQAVGTMGSLGSTGRSGSTTGRTQRVLTFSTVPHPSLVFYLHQYRPEKQDGRAVVPRLVHKWLTPRALAYWYMYAGQRGQPSQRGTRGQPEGSIILDAGMYQAKEVALIVKALKARTIDCAQSKRGKGSKGQRAVRFSGPSAQFLWKFMEPFVLEEVKVELSPVVGGRSGGGRRGGGRVGLGKFTVGEGGVVVGEEKFVGGAKGVAKEEARESEEDRREGWVSLTRAVKEGKEGGYTS
ncbi:unnamed protein product [Closterium sp. Naga37s-1]|nr:unnamed protein product [Closterium sp. Naga37s-1]